VFEVYGIMRIKREHEEANVLDVCVTRTMPTSVKQRQISPGKPLTTTTGIVSFLTKKSVPNVRNQLDLSVANIVLQRIFVVFLSTEIHPVV
jgi:hypothetical protein